MSTEIVKPTATDKLVAEYSQLDPAASAALWGELDGAVDKSIVGIDRKFENLGAELVRVKAFLSQLENPGRKKAIEGMVGFPADLTWMAYLADVAERLKMSPRNLRDKLAGYELGIDESASSAKRREERERLKLLREEEKKKEEDAASQSAPKLAKLEHSAAVNLIDTARATGEYIRAVDAGADPTEPLREMKVAAAKVTPILDGIAEQHGIDWRGEFIKLLDALRGEKLGKVAAKALAHAESLVAKPKAGKATGNVTGTSTVKVEVADVGETDSRHTVVDGKLVTSGKKSMVAYKPVPVAVQPPFDPTEPAFRRNPQPAVSEPVNAATA
jgi:hypothetical protein